MKVIYFADIFFNAYVYIDKLNLGATTSCASSSTIAIVE